MNALTLTSGSDVYTFENLVQFEGFEYPSTRPVIEDLPYRTGAHYITSKFGRRRLSWTGYLLEDRFTERTSMVQAMPQGELKTLKFTTYGDLELQAEVEIVQVLNPHTKKQNLYQIEAIALDHRLYSQELQSTTTGITAQVGGTDIPTEIPLSLAVTFGSLKPTITNDGHTSAPATFVIEGPGTDFTIQNQTTGEILYLDLTLLTGERVTITETTAVKGTHQNVFGSVSGDRWSVDPGNNIVHFDALTGSDDNTQLTVSFRHSYLGV